MPNERLEITLAEDYALAIGRVTYVFAVLEWQVVWCAEKLKAGFIANIGVKTAGNIGREFELLVLAISDEALKAAILPLAKDVRCLVRERNSILHGKPGTVKTSGQQRLFRDGSPWHIPELDDAADRFAACSTKLNSIYYDALQSYVS